MINCGKFDLHVEWELKSQPTPVTPPVPSGKAAAKPRAASAAKDAAAQAAVAPIFLFEPKVFPCLLRCFPAVHTEEPASASLVTFQQATVMLTLPDWF